VVVGDEHDDRRVGARKVLGTARGAYTGMTGLGDVRERTALGAVGVLEMPLRQPDRVHRKRTLPSIKCQADLSQAQWLGLVGHLVDEHREVGGAVDIAEKGEITDGGIRAVEEPQSVVVSAHEVTRYDDHPGVRSVPFPFASFGDAVVEGTFEGKGHDDRLRRVSSGPSEAEAFGELFTPGKVVETFDLAEAHVIERRCDERGIDAAKLGPGEPIDRELNRIG
ncbi:MAG: hypothetical protein JWP10_1238, partial [Nocardioidaceae bacterium]|nr:hypothetical protein [Nocardioidaceae bacterium]